MNGPPESDPEATLAQPPRELPRRLGPFQLVRVAGSGAMGVVYQARDLELDRWVAIKRLQPDLPDDEGSSHAARLLNEARAVARLSHPHVAQIYQVGDDEGRPYIAMEWLDGVDMASHVRLHGPLPWREAVAAATAVAAALDAAHRAGLVHRDIKPANLMRLADGTVKVVDFGLARSPQMASNLTATGAIVGTPAYMAPEQCLGEPATAQSDLYALGCTLYFMLTGVAPFRAAHALGVLDQHVRQPFPDARDRAPDVPEALVDLMAAVTAKQPVDRVPSAATWRAGLERLLATDSTVRLPRAAVSVKAAPPPAPAERNLFVGRQRELARLADMLGDGERLVSVLGIGGIGKTRFVSRYAKLAPTAWPGGVHFADLSDATTLGGLHFAVAQTLGVGLGNDDPATRIGHAIAGRGRCLVILDNFEQLVAHAGSTVGAWFDRCPEAVFLVTSRERLHLPGETVFELPPLSLADEAVELFGVRAAAQRSRFTVDDANRSAVTSLVKLLDGLPLAIELAAARVGVLSPAQIVERMRDRFALLGRAQGGVSRQSTLRAAIDWSWELLSPIERSALAQCAVFDGAFTLPMAEAVLDLSQAPEQAAVMDVVQALVDKSLLRSWVPADEGQSALDEPHFGMFLGVREYAAARLAEGNAVDQNALERRHGAACAGLCSDEVLASMTLDRGLAHRQRLMGVIDNLVAACRRAIERADAATALATCRGVRDLLSRRGPYALSVELAQAVAALPTLTPRMQALAAATLSSSLRQVGRNDEASTWLDRALQGAQALADDRLHARLLAARGGLDRESGQPDQARQRLEQALTWGRSTGDPLEQIGVLQNLAQLDTDQGETTSAGRHLEAALTLARSAGESGIEAQLLMPLGVLLAEQGRFDQGRAHFEAALRRARASGDRSFEGEVLTNLGCLDQDQGRLDSAAHHFEQALALHRELGDRRWEGFVLGDLGRLQMLRGDLVAAQRDLDLSLQIMREIGNRRIVGSELRSLGDVHRLAGRFEAARQAYAEAEQALRPIGDRYYLAFVVCGQADLERAAGRIEQARALLQDARALGAVLGVSDTSELGRRLSASSVSL